MTLTKTSGKIALWIVKDQRPPESERGFDYNFSRAFDIDPDIYAHSLDDLGVTGDDAAPAPLEIGFDADVLADIWAEFLPVRDRLGLQAATHIVYIYNYEYMGPSSEA